MGNKIQNATNIYCVLYKELRNSDDNVYRQITVPFYLVKYYD